MRTDARATTLDSFLVPINRIIEKSREEAENDEIDEDHDKGIPYKKARHERTVEKDDDVAVVTG